LNIIELMSDVVAILGLAFVGSIIALIGGVIFLVKRSWSDWLSLYSIPFASGVFMVISLLALLPEALEAMGETAFYVVLGAFFVSYFFENFFSGDVHHFHGHDHSSGVEHAKASVPLVIVGDTIHNFIDGVVIASTYLINPGLGVITTLSTFLHEIPHEIGDFGVMLKAGWKRMNIFWVNLLSASTTILGAVFMLFFVKSDMVVGVFLAITTGLFLYIGASNFLPHIHDKDVSRAKTSTALILGIVIMLGALLLIPHSH